MAAGAVFAFLSALGFGSGQVLVRIATQQLPVPLVALLAVSTATLLNLCLALVLDFQGVKALSLEPILWLGFIGGLAVVGGRLLNFNAINMVGATRAAPFSSSSPVFAAALAIAFLGERPGLLVGLGTPVVVCGLTLVALGGARGTGASGMTPRKLGYLLAVMAAVSFATVSVAGKHVVSDFTTPLVASAISLLLGMSLLSIVAGRDVIRGMRRPLPKYVLVCLFAGMLQGLAQLSLLESLSRADVTMVTPIYASSPLVTLILAHFFLRRLERINLFVVGGTFFTIGGVTLVLVGMAS